MSLPNKNHQGAIPAIFAIHRKKTSSNSSNSISKPLIVDMNESKKDSPAKSNSGFSSENPGSRSLTTEEWLDSAEAAAYLKVSLGALRNMTSNGQVPFYKMGRRNRYRTEELRQLLLSQKRGVRNGN